MNKKLHHSFIVSFALRYALHRHSCAPSIVASYISDNWSELDASQQCGILKDIREHLHYHREWQEDACNSIDYATWQNLYNELTHRTKQ